MQNDLIRAQVWLDKAYQLAGHQNLNKKNKNKILFELNLNQNLLNLKSGRLDGVEGFMIEADKNATDQFSKVGHNYLLGELYAVQNRRDEAISCFRYAAENGNTLYEAAKARYYLNQLISHT
jgi:hypothetical protein